MSYREDVLSEIFTMIDYRFKRNKPTVCSTTRYETEKSLIETDIKNKKHFGEIDWPDSTRAFLDRIRNLRDDTDSDSSLEGKNYQETRHVR